MAIYMTGRRNPKQEKELEFELKKIPRLIKGCAEGVPHLECGKLIGKSYTTYTQRLAKPGALTLDELATFAAGDWCPTNAVIENVSAYITAKAEMLKKGIC